MAEQNLHVTIGSRIYVSPTPWTRAGRRGNKVSELRERAEALLRPAIASLDAITAPAGESAAGERGHLAGQFVEFKLYATFHLAEQIREGLRPTTAEPKQDGSAVPTALQGRDVRPVCS